MTVDTWTFSGTPFHRMDPAGQARSWPRTLNVVVDVVAGDTSASPRRYVDIGAVEYGRWAMRGGCESLVSRDALVSLFATQGTLITAAGTSYAALCVKADPIAHDGGMLYYIDIEFELLS